MTGFEKLWKDGKMAIVHGVGYDQPSFSHFSSMAFLQTGAPNSGEAHGWLGRLADVIDPLGHNANPLINIDDHQSLAVTAMNHVPLVFDDPDRFTRRIYATLIRGWMGHQGTAAILNDDFTPLPVFDRAA
jgi:hypothetical protein